MKMKHARNLDNAVEVKATNRPLKIVYLVPFEDELQTQVILDAVFFESYTRWAGVFTLIIPTTPNQFEFEGYEGWLSHFDPDFIYSYVDLEAPFVEKIDRLCSPIAFLEHKVSKRDQDESGWKYFIPSWGTYIDPVPSLSMIQSPESLPRRRPDEVRREPTIFTQLNTEPANRFLADNFGTGLSVHQVTHAIPGFYRTLCLVPAELPESTTAGSERCHSVLDSYRLISENKATPIARLAMVNAAGVFRPQPRAWTSAFHIFIGSTPLDRIHFWNSRHLGANWSDIPTSLILEQDLLTDEGFLKQLGQYLNNHNFLGSGSGPYQVEIHSGSVDADTLSSIRDRLKPHTSNSVNVSKSHDSRAIATEEDWAHRLRSISMDNVTLKLTEISNIVTATEPAHFIYTQPQFRRLIQGQWGVDLTIERHNGGSKYSNVNDMWILPRRRRIASTFTRNLAKPTIGGKLAVVPTSKRMGDLGRSINAPCFYEINLPSDETFFRNLVLTYGSSFPSDDLRRVIPKSAYVDIGVSDKGQNLRGVISMFGSLSTAFEILTNKFWRSIFSAARSDSATPLTFTFDQLRSFLPNDKETLQRFMRELRFDNIGITKKYMLDGVKDALEYLVRSNIFYQVAHWPCTYCGHKNSRSFDRMKIKNECDICATEFLAPIDIEWMYELNHFVYRSIEKHYGRPVLWALGFLQDMIHAAPFWYLPEVDLFESDDDSQLKNEIDALCVLNGKFYAIEAKRSASLFVNEVGEQEKFVKVITRLRPDVALLAFERYCKEDDDPGVMRERLTAVVERIRGELGPWTKVMVRVADDFNEFCDFSVSLGWDGPRTLKYNELP